MGYLDLALISIMKGLKPLRLNSHLKLFNPFKLVCLDSIVYCHSMNFIIKTPKVLFIGLIIQLTGKGYKLFDQL
jgi:hypothetical protein